MARKWTPEEDALLIELYHTVPVAQIAIPGRTMDAINNRAGRLRIRRSQKNSRVMSRNKTKRVTDWSPLLSEILDKAIELHERGIKVECRTKYEGKIELMAFFAEIA